MLMDALQPGAPGGVAMSQQCSHAHAARFSACAGWQVPYGFHAVFITEQELASQLPA